MNKNFYYKALMYYAPRRVYYPNFEQRYSAKPFSKRSMTSWHKRFYRTMQCFFKLSIKISVKYVEFVSEIFSTQSVPFDVPAQQHQGKNTEYLLIPPWK